MACIAPSPVSLLRHLPVGRLIGLCARQTNAAGALLQQRAAATLPASWQQPSSTASRTTLSLVATAPQVTELLAHYFASELQPGDCYLLYGSVGAGKSYFSRAFIRAAAGDDNLPVPSPTFLLQNVYNEHEGPPIHHYDLYRLTEPHDLNRLDLQMSFSSAVSLIEWPERLGGSLAPANHLSINLSVLELAEQQRLQAEKGMAAPAAEVDSSDGWDSGLEEAGDSSSDERWRRIQLATDCQRWQGRLHLLHGYLQAEGPRYGCWVEQ